MQTTSLSLDSSAQRPRPHASRAIARFLARLSMSAIVIATSLAAILVSAPPSYASGDTVDVDLDSLYTIATTWGLVIGPSNIGNDSAVVQSGAADKFKQLWRFQPTGVQNGQTQYELVNVFARECLSVYYNSLNAGAGVVIYECRAYSDQLWTLSAHGALVSIQSVSSGLYLDVPGNSATWDTQLVQNPSTSLGNPPHEFFGLVKYFSIQTSPHTYRLTTGWSEALDVASNDDDAAVIQTGVAIGKPTQSWSFVRQTGGYYELVNVGTGKCLSVYYNSLAAGGKLVQYDCHAWPDQLWDLLPNGVGGYSVALRAASTDYAAEVPGGTPVFNTQLDQWPFNNGSNQYFVLTAL